MKNFIFGVLSTVGIMALCSKCYDKGYEDSKELNDKNSTDSKKKTKNK